MVNSEGPAGDLSGYAQPAAVVNPDVQVLNLLSKCLVEYLVVRVQNCTLVLAGVDEKSFRSAFIFLQVILSYLTAKPAILTAMCSDN